MQTIDLLPGTDIDRAARLLVSNAPARADFNGIAIRAKYATTKPSDITARFRRLCDERSYAYQCSPEGKRAAERSRHEVAAKQAIADGCMIALGPLRLAESESPDLGEVLSWVERMAEAVDRVGVTFDRAIVVETFRAAGWEPGANCGDAFDANDARNFAGWIVGQVLDGYEKRGCVPGIIHGFVADWRARFESTVQPS